MRSLLTVNTIIAAIVLCFCSAQVWALQDNRIFRKGEVIYVHSIKGLTLRKDSSTRSKRMATIPYGAKLKVIAYARLEDTEKFDNIQGFWINVKYQNHDGYVFSGFVSTFPTPDNKTTVAEYAKKLKRHNIKHQYRQKKTLASRAIHANSRTSKRDSLELKKATMLDGFLIARKLFHIPNQLKPPHDGTTKKVTVPDPKKPQQVWTRELNFEHNRKKKIEKIEYVVRQEGSGQRATVEKGKSKKIHIWNHAYAD